MAAKDYVGDGITIHWEPERCEHAGRCVGGSPTVFDPKARPWITPLGATADEIAATIDTCPSGALSYTRHADG